MNAQLKSIGIYFVVAVAFVSVLLLGTRASASPTLGNGYTFPDGTSLNYSVSNTEFGQANLWFNVQFRHPELDNASWSLSVQPNNTEFWSASLYMAGPLTDALITPGASMNLNSMVSNGGVSMNNNLSLGYWHDDYVGVNNMMLGGSFLLTPAAIDSAAFQRREFATWFWDGNGIVQNPVPNYWVASIDFYGHFLPTSELTGAQVGAAFLATVPEPATMVLMAIGGVAMLRRHKH